MRVIVPLALELVLFNEVWFLVLMPPVTLVVLACNLGLFFVLVRPKSWESRIVGMMLGGVAAVFAAGAYYLLSYRLGSFRVDQIGVLGNLARSGLGSWRASLANPAGDLATVLLLISRHMTEIEGVLLVILGVAIIWAGGRLDEWCRLR